MIRFTCPACGQKLCADPAQASGQALCPRCRMTVLVPGDSIVPLPPPAHDDEWDDDEAIGSGFSKPIEKIDPEDLIDMTAMVDIVFFLLIFFLVTSFAAVYSSSPLPNPESDEAGAASLALDEEEAEGDWITIRIGRDDAVEVEDVPLHDLSDLDFRLREIQRAGRGNDGVMILAHGDATHGSAVAVLDAAYEMGTDRLKMKVSDAEE